MISKLEQELINLRSYLAADDILTGIKLHPLQIADVLKMIYSKRAIVRYDTGTGKTLLAAGAMKLLWNEDSSRSFLMFIKKDQCVQTPKKLMDAIGRPVLSTSATEKDVRENILSGRYLSYPLVLLTHDCLKNKKVMMEIFKHREKFCGVIIDEAHVVNNKGYAQSADMMSGLVSRFEYCWALTATPILVNVLQLAKLANLVDPQRYPNYKKLQRDIEHGYFSIEQDPLFFINRNAEELGRFSNYVGHILWVNAMSHQQEIRGGDLLLQMCKGKGALEQVNCLVQLVKAMEGKRGLIYIRQHAVRHWVLPFLEEAGISYDCINGNVVKERADILRRFNEEKSIDVLITSVTTAIDADCDYVIFYEFTTELKQMIGRTDRGLTGKTVDVFYILTRNSREPSYFWENIVARSEMVKQILGGSNKEIETVMAEVEKEA